MRRARTQPTHATPQARSGAPSAPVCPRCLGITPGLPGGQSDKPYPGPFTPGLCLECARASGWRALVAWPHEQTKWQLPVWQWELNPASHVLLCPGLGNDGKSTRVAIVAETLKGTAKGLDNNAPRSTAMRVHWWGNGMHQSEEAVVPNALVLRYVSTAALADAFLQALMPYSMWDYTHRHPDRPGERLEGPPAFCFEPPQRRKRILDLSFIDDE